MSFLSLGSDLLGNVFNRNSAKRKNKWSRENMQFAIVTGKQKGHYFLTT
jgi:hypothetical protein